MKTNLTPEQSQRLIELGVDPSKASSQNIYMKQGYGSRGIFQTPVAQPIFDLSDILSLLPKEIIIERCPYHLNIDYPYLLSKGVAARYLDEEEDSLTGVLCPELIDALYELLVWVIENGYCQPTLSPTEK